MTLIFRQNISVGYKEAGETGPAFTGENLAVDLYISEEKFNENKSSILKTTRNLNQTFVEAANLEGLKTSIAKEYSTFTNKIVIQSQSLISFY